MSQKARIVNIETGDVHDFTNGTFVLHKSGALTSDEINILKLLSKDVQPKRICDSLNISYPLLQQKKKKIFDKLKVQTWITAVYQAHRLKYF
jgi:DNA-binding CsgD family transcriptional regulator